MTLEVPVLVTVTEIYRSLWSLSLSSKSLWPFLQLIIVLWVRFSDISETKVPLVFASLPMEHSFILARLAVFLGLVLQNSARNKLSSTKLAGIFGPVFARAKPGKGKNRPGTGARLS
jgi:hypothetical protein